MTTSTKEMSDIITSLLVVASFDVDLGLDEEDCERVLKLEFLRKPKSFDGFDVELTSGDRFRVTVARIPGEVSEPLLDGRTHDDMPEVAT